MSGPEPRDSLSYWQGRLVSLDAQRAAVLANSQHDYASLQDITTAVANCMNQIRLLGGPQGAD